MNTDMQRPRDEALSPSDAVHGETAAVDLSLHADVRRLLDLLEARPGDESAGVRESKIDRYIERVSKASTFFSTVVLASVGLVFTSCNSIYQAERNEILERQRIDTSRLDVMRQFVRSISRKEERHAAITTIASLGHRDLALKLAMLHPEDGYATAVSVLSVEGDRREVRALLSRYIRSSLQFIEMDYRNIDAQVRSLDDLFDQIPNKEYVPLLQDVFSTIPNLREEVARSDLSRLSELLKKPEVRLILDSPLAPAGVVNFVKKLENPRGLVESGKRAISNYRDFEELFTKDYVNIIDKIEGRLDAVLRKLDKGEARGAELLELMDLYVESRHALDVAKEDWGDLRLAFVGFVDQARSELESNGGSPNAKKFEDCYQRLSEKSNKIRSKRCQVMMQNAQSVYSSIGNY